MHKSLDEFEFRQDPTSDYGVSCHWASEKSMYIVVNTQDPSFFSLPVQSTGRAIVLTFASALGLAFLFPSRHFQVLLKSISWQPLIRKHSYLDHRYPVGLAFIP